jgi:hypothetical protein
MEAPAAAAKARQNKTAIAVFTGKNPARRDLLIVFTNATECSPHKLFI